MKTPGVKLREFAGLVATRLRSDSGLYLFIALYAQAGMFCLGLADATDRAAYAIYVGRGLIMFGILMPSVALIADFLWSIHRFDKRRLLVFRHVFSPSRIAHFVAGLCLLQAMTIFFGTFTSVKNVLPLLHDGFPFDRWQADFDALLHFGVDPWRLIQPLWGTDSIRAIIEWNYNVLWFILCYGAMFFVVTSPRAGHLRFRYMIGFMLVWIVVGNLLAGMFLSAGPAFYGFVTGDTLRFAEQLEFLARSGEGPFSAARIQNYLWTLQDIGRTGIGTGISAFPSVHVALVAYNAFFLFSYSRKLGMIAFAYVGLVILSSVYLAWHYAIDGYAGLVVSGLIFLAVTRWLPMTKASPLPGTGQAALKAS